MNVNGIQRNTMENKVIFEGVLLNIPKITDFGSTLLRVKNTRTYKKKDGTPGETTYTATVSVEWRKLAEEVVNRFKQNDLIRVEGELKKKKTDKVDQNGDEIWETWIRAQSVNALSNMQSVAHINNPQPKGPAHIPPALPKKAPYSNQSSPQGYAQASQNRAGSSFDNQPLPVQAEDPNQVFEEVFEGDLPF